MAGTNRREFLSALGVGAAATVALPVLAGSARASRAGVVVHPHDLADIQRTITPARLEESCEYDIRVGFERMPAGIDRERVHAYLDGKYIPLCCAASPSRGYIIIYGTDPAKLTRHLRYDGGPPVRCTILYGSVEVRHV